VLQGTKVTAEVAGNVVEGIIVGMAYTVTTGLMIVECTDGSLPNDTYPYTHFIMCESLIHVCKTEGD
jgi:hypothetical protein